ncbi:hypothetical protein MHU86_12359 [Fragilaria crotonensis]|nr:hypothetical protein MHU86_12359 [Fragilaria crotonensis]
MVSRSVYSVNYDAIRGDGHRMGRCEMDSHADTCVAGSNCVILEYTGSTAEVEAYSPDYPSKQGPIATVATAYDCTTSATTYVLIINEALYLGDSLSFSLLSPNQLRDNDVLIDERHRQHAQDSIFGIHVPSASLTIPFTLKGVVACFDTRPPTQDELDDTSLHVEITSDIEWIPSTFALSLAEEEDTNSDDERMISTLQARCMKVLPSKTAKHKIKCCLQVLAATQFPFEMQIANEFNAIDHIDPILRRVVALATVEQNSEEVTTVAAIMNEFYCVCVILGYGQTKWGFSGLSL